MEKEQTIEQAKTLEIELLQNPSGNRIAEIQFQLHKMKSDLPEDEYKRIVDLANAKFMADSQKEYEKGLLESSQHCPICNGKVLETTRFPTILCTACTVKSTDTKGEKTCKEIFDLYYNNSKNNVCYVNEHECRVSEFPMSGAIVYLFVQ